MGELGSLLTRAREGRGLTIEDAERDTRISRRYLMALEAEQFEVVPAPVYARGFLRSYSQYLGLDPQEVLLLFPREDEPEYQRVVDATVPPPRASKDRPVSPVSASRPTWRGGGPGPAPERPPEGERPPWRGGPGAARQPGGPPPGRPAPRGGQPPRGMGRAGSDDTYEPVIGVDIGVPSPARKLKTDPAAQTRSLVIAVVAIGVILAVVVLALLLSNAGGDSEPPSGASTNETPTPEATGDGTAAAGTTVAASGLNVTPGVVPDLLGVAEATAVAAIQEAGFVPEVRRQASSDPAGTVIDQSPAAEIAYAAGSTVIVVVSEGN